MESSIYVRNDYLYSFNLVRSVGTENNCYKLKKWFIFITEYSIKNESCTFQPENEINPENGSGVGTSLQ